MPSFLDQIQAIASGIVTAAQPVTSWLTDTRSPDLSRPRIDASDPASAIDITNSTGILSFPSDRPKYYMTFGFQDYSRPSQFEGLQANSVTDYLCLPIPNNLRDNNSLNWAQDKSNIIIEAVSASINDMGKTGAVDANTVSTALNGLGAGITGAGVNLAKKTLNDIGNLLPGGSDLATGAQQILGLADNPFMTVAFKGPDFKTHSFYWRLSPKTTAESQTILTIVNTLKKCAYPELLSAQSGGFYKYPKIVCPKFMPDEAANYLYAFKPCVITNLNINYSPNDRPGFFAGTSAPVEAVLELQLTEIELWRNGGGLQPNQGTTTSDFSNVQTPPGVTIKDIGTL